MSLEWNVYYHNFNGRKLEPYNVFNHWGFMEDLRKNRKKNNKDKTAFLSTLLRDTKYWYWSKCEWEIIISPWAGQAEERKIDVYDQLSLNWEKFCEYVWENRGQIK